MEKDFPINIPASVRVSKWKQAESTKKPHGSTESPPVDINVAAHDLKQHWQKGYPARKDRKKVGIKAEVGEPVDAEVSNWHSIGPGTGVGFAFILPKHERRGSLYIREKDVITTGTIRLGTIIRCVVVSPPPGFNNNF
jgi:hypothetical protein